MKHLRTLCFINCVPLACMPVCCSDDKNASGSPLSSPVPKTKGPTESLGFMNALSSSNSHQKVKKVKKIVPRLQSNSAKPSTPARQDVDEQGRSVPTTAEGMWVGLGCTCVVGVAFMCV